LPNRSSTARLAERLSAIAFRAAKRVRQGLAAALLGVSDRRVVFVGGVQRSGTNMVMDALERSLETVVYHERDPRAFHEFQMRPPPVIRALVAEAPARTVVVKALCELQDLGRLLDDFAPAKAIWVVRRYEDMVNSHMKKWRGCPATLGAMVADPAAGGWRGRGMSEAARAVLARHHRPDMSDASAVALFWYLRNVLYFEQGFERDPRLIAVRYESLVREPEAQFRRLFAFLELPYGRRIAKGLFASSVGRDPPPDIAPDVRRLCDDLARRFEPFLGP
jgi:hypothetical protein